jgi:branched-chain amino acid transport system substrate-binding protein
MRRLPPALCAALVLVGCRGGSSIEFGAILPITGPAGVYGESVRKGIELAYEQVVARNDLEQTIELEILDSESNPQKAAELLRQLYSGGTLAVIGGVTTAEALAMVPEADRADRVLLSPSASSPELTGISKNFFRVFFSDFDEGTRMGNFAAGKGYSPVVILAKEEPWAKGVQEIFAEEFARSGGEVLEVLEFPASTSDFSGLVDRVNTLRPAAVYLAAYAQDVAKLVEEIRASDYKGKILTTHAFASPAVLEGVGEAAYGVLLTAPHFDVDAEGEPVSSFIDSYAAKYGDAPDVWAAHGYDAMMVFVAAIPKPFRTASDFRTGLRSIEDFPGVAGVVRFDERGDVGKFPRVYQVMSDGLRDYETDITQEKEELLRKLRELREERRRAAMQQQN